MRRDLRKTSRAGECVEIEFRDEEKWEEGKVKSPSRYSSLSSSSLF